MIDLGQPALHAEGVTVFTDHADPSVFTYVPDAPGLRAEADGTPELSLLKYRLDPAAVAVLGNGLLSLTVDLSVPPDRLARLRSKLAARTGHSPITLAPVLAESARADIILLGQSTVEGVPSTDAGPTLVQPLAVGAPMLVGDHAATFAAVLSTEGASLVEGAMRHGGLPLGIIYRLQVSGIRPALRASITARWADIYRYYENRLNGGKLLAAVDIGATVEDLVHSEAITVTIDDLVPPQEHSATDHHAIDEVQRYVMEKLFTPTLGQAPPPPDAEAEGLAAVGTAIKDVFGFFSLTYTLRQIDRDELRTFRYDLQTAQVEILTLSPQGSFDTALTTTQVDRLIREIPPNASPEMIFDLGVARDLAAEDIDRIEVAMDYGDQRVDLVLDAATPRRTQSVWFDPAHGQKIGWAYTVHFVPASGDVDQVSAVRRTTDQRVLRIDPRELYDRVQTRIITAGVPFDRYPRVLVDLRYTQPASGWSAESTLELGATTLETSQTVRVSPGRPLLVQRRVRYVDQQGQVETLDWETATAGVLIIGDPLPDVVDVQILAAARFGVAVARLIVELRPRSDPGRVDTRILTRDTPVATWSWAVRGDGQAPPATPDQRAYDYRVTVHTMLAEVREGDWLAGPAGKLVVGEGFAALRQVSLYLVGSGTLASRGLMAVKVRFAYTDTASSIITENEVLVTDPSQPIPWTYPVAALDRLAFTVQLTAVGADGAVHPQEPITTADLIVIAPLPEAG